MATLKTRLPDLTPTPAVAEACRLQQEADYEEMHQRFAEHFPWLVQRKPEPDQRGFLIGSERL